MRIKRNLLLAGVALVIPLYGFVIVNTVLSPWTFLERNRALLALFALLALGAMLGFARAANRHEALLARHARAVRIVAVAAFFVLQIALSFQLRFSPGTDCGACYLSAKRWVFEGQISDYYMMWLSITPNNFALLVLDTMIQRFMCAVPWLAGIDLYYGIVTVNALLFALAMWAAMKLLCRLRGGAGQAVFAANMALCLPMLYCTSELYTDALSMPFLMLAVCLLTLMMRAKREGAAHALALLAGAVVLAGMELRATVAIAAIAAAIVLLLTCKPRRLLCMVTLCAVLAAGHTAFMRYRDDVLGRENLERWSMPAVHWLAMGTPDPYGYFNGSFSSEDLLFARNIEDPQERSQALWAQLRERVYALRYPDRLLSALSRKLLNTFGDGTYNLSQILDSDNLAPRPLKAVLVDDSPEHAAYRHVCTGIMLAQLLFACAGAAWMIRRREAERFDALCAVHLVGIFLLLAVWETNARYFFHAVPVMLMLSAMGQQRAAAALEAARRGRKRA